MTQTRGLLASFHAPVGDWFRASFDAPTRPQQLGWPAIASGASTLILAPTGSGKTLAAFLSAIDGIMFGPVPAKATRCSVLYVSPLKALAVDVERNLRAPIAGIARHAERAGIAFHVDARQRLWVYGRAGEPCHACGTPIGSVAQGEDARRTYWCRTCQPGVAHSSGSRLHA